MSSIRLFLLDALSRGDDMHGHQLRQLAEQEHVDHWTDVSVGALYGALKRCAADGLIDEVRLERQGNYPERRVWRITDAGRAVLDELRRAGLAEVVVRADPFDLALARVGADLAPGLADIVTARLERLRILLDEEETMRARVDRWLTEAERFVMTHRTHRLRSELDWHRELLGRLPAIVSDEIARKDPR